MFKNKKLLILLSVVLVLMLSLLCFAKISQRVTSAPKAIEKGYNITNGSYEVSVSSHFDSDGSSYTNPTYKFTGITTGSQHLISILYDNNGQQTNLENVIFIDFEADNMYIKAAPIMNFLSNTYGIISNTAQINDKWLTVPLPDLTYEDGNYIDDFKNTLTKAMVSFAEAETFTKENSCFVMTKDNGKDFASLITAISNLLSSQSETITTNIYNVWAKFTPGKYGNYFSSNIFGEYPEPSQTIVKNKFDAAITKLNSFASSITNSSESNCTLSISYKDKYQQDLTVCLPENDGLKTAVISFSSSRGNTKITPPETNTIMSTNDSTIYIKNLIDSIYTVTTSDEHSLSKERYVPKYTTEISNNILICTRSNELFSESIFYAFENEALSSISAQVQATDAQSYTALKDYYTTLGYQIVPESTSDSEFKASFSAPQTLIEEEYQNVTNIESLQKTLQ